MAHWTQYVLAFAIWLQFQTNAYAQMNTSQLKTEFRSQGYGGLESVLERHPEELRASRYGSSEPEVEAAHQLLDEVCQQRDCAYSKLFWHTELTAALEQAGREGKPVLTLRLLGKLTDPLSCAVVD